MQMSYDEPNGLEYLTAEVSVHIETFENHSRAQELLAEHERRRQASFGNTDRRCHFALGRLALREVAAERLDITPEAVEIRVAADGAPEVDGLHVSISHGGAGGAAVGLAAAASVAVGVDVEPIRERRPDLWRRILRQDEHDLLDALGGPSDRAHTLLWSMKEAVLKGQRTGLRAGARSVRLSGLVADGDSGSARASSDRTGEWAIHYARRDDLWLVVAVVSREGS